MKRPLFICLVALLAGVYSAYFTPDSVPFLALLIFALVLLVLCLFKKPVFCFFCAVLCFLFGALYLLAVSETEDRPMHAFVNEYVTVFGEVTEEPETDDEGAQTFTARLHRLSFLNETIAVSERVRLTVPGGEKQLSFGDCFSAICLFRIPQMKSSTGSFDYALYLKSKNIFFVGTAEPGTLTKTGTFVPNFSERLYALNRRCGAGISAILPDEAAAVLRAISFSDKTELSDELSAELTVCGLSHVVAVSGMHVTILLSAIFTLLSLLKRNKYKFFLPLCGLVLLFMLFTGASPSVVRAAVMSSLSLLAFLCFRKEDSLTSLSLAAGIIVIINPFAAFDLGFILSFGATLGILLFAQPMQMRVFSLLHLEEQKGFWAGLLKSVLSILCVTVSVQLFLLPLLSVLFGEVSLWCFVTNLLVTPLLPVLLVGGILVGFLGLIHPYVALPVAGFVYPFLKAFLNVVHLFGRSGFAVLTVGAFSFFGVYVYGVLLLAFYKVLQKRYLQSLILAAGMPVLLCLFLCLQLLFPKATVTFIDVGQGDCALLTLPGGVTALIDGGGTTYETDYDVGREVVLPHLKKEGIVKLTYMVASHPHGDHIGGLLSVMEELPVENLLVPVGFDAGEAGYEFLQKASASGINIRKLSAEDSVLLGDESSFEILMPDETWLSMLENENDASMVFCFRYGNNSVLFMGDLENDGESYLIENHSPVETTVLKVAHHGAGSSTGETFLDWSGPLYAYIPCGQNHFGHPSPALLERLFQENVTTYRADEDGNVTFIFNKKKIQSIVKGR